MNIVRRQDTVDAILTSFLQEKIAVLKAANALGWQLEAAKRDFDFDATAISSGRQKARKISAFHLAVETLLREIDKDPLFQIARLVPAAYTTRFQVVGKDTLQSACHELKSAVSAFISVIEPGFGASLFFIWHQVRRPGEDAGPYYVTRIDELNVLTSVMNFRFSY